MEYIASILAFIAVMLLRKKRAIAWPIDMVASLIFMFIFFQKGLFFQVGLFALFVVQDVIGTIRWRIAGDFFNTSPIKISGVIKTFVVAMLCFWFGDVIADANGFQSLDVSIAFISVIANILMIRQKAEAWIFWTIVNISMIMLCINNNLYATAVLYVAFLINALVAIYGWSKKTYVSNV